MGRAHVPAGKAQSMPSAIHLELLQRRTDKATVADLRTEVKDCYSNRTYICFDMGNKLFNTALFDSIDHKAGGQTTSISDFIHELIKAGFITSTRNTSMVALASESLSHMTADTSTRTKNQYHRFAHIVALKDSLKVINNNK